MFHHVEHKHLTSRVAQQILNKAPSSHAEGQAKKKLCLLHFLTCNVSTSDDSAEPRHNYSYSLCFRILYRKLSVMSLIILLVSCFIYISNDVCAYRRK